MRVTGLVDALVQSLVETQGRVSERADVRCAVAHVFGVALEARHERLLAAGGIVAGQLTDRLVVARLEEPRQLHRHADARRTGHRYCRASRRRR